MGYDLAYGTPHASSNAPVAVLRQGIADYATLGIPPEKLVLAVPWYGYDVPCLNALAPPVNVTW